MKKNLNKSKFTISRFLLFFTKNSKKLAISLFTDINVKVYQSSSAADISNTNTSKIDILLNK